MKVKINLDFDIELSQDGQRLSLFNLLHTAQTAAVNATQNVAGTVSPPSSQPETDARTDEEGRAAAEVPSGVEVTSGGETGSGNGAAAKTEDRTSTHDRVGPDGRARRAFASELDSQTLHPLGVFLCDLLDRAAEASRQVNDQVVKTQEGADEG
jgi:hypothetical protein